MNHNYPDEGWLQVNVSAEDAAVPLSGAVVRITDATGEQVIEEL